MITLYKGDDTGGQLGKNVKIMFHCDDAVDMDDVVVKFDLLGIVKREFTDVHDGDVLDIFISHAESRKFPLGVIFAKMWGEDASGKLRTFANRIPFRVTLNLIAVYGSDGTDSQDIHVYSSVDWDSIANKPTVFPSSVGEVEGLQEALDEINEKIPFDASADNQLADKEWVDQEIDRVAAYYITSDAQGNPFQTRAALLNAETYYSGGSPRTPTRNDYAIVLADESHDNTEWRYIYSENDQGVGVWEAQYPVEGAIVADDNVTKTSTNPVKSSGIWAAIWGALAAIPSGFTSLYDWVVAQLVHKRDYTDRSYNTQVTVNAPALHATLTSRGTQILEYYLPCTEDIPATPAINHVYTWRKDGAEFYITQGVSVYSTVWILYGSGGEQLATTTTDNTTDGWFPNLSFVVSANSEVTTTKVNSYPAEIHDTLALNSDIPTSLPWSAITGKPQSFAPSVHASTHASNGSDPITPPSIGAVPTSRTVNGKALSENVTLLGTDILVDGLDDTTVGQLLNILYLSKAPLNSPEFTGTPTAPTAAAGTNTQQVATTAFVQGAVSAKANRAANPTAGNLAALDAQGNPTDSGVKASAKLDSTSAAPAFSTSSTYAVGYHVTYNGGLYRCTTAVTTAGAWTGSTNWTADTMTDPDAVLDITAQNQLRVVAKDGTVLWAQGYDLASTSSATLACDATNNFTFADGATTQAFTLPTAPTGKAGDFGLDIDNSANTGAATMTLTGLDTTFSVIVPKGESLNDMLAIAAGELARFYITLSSFRINNLPTWHIMKQIVENGGATV